MKTNVQPIAIEFSRLKTDFNGVHKVAEKAPVALLSNGEAVAYLISVQHWRHICNQLDDIGLLQIVNERIADGQKSIRLNLNDL